jgi:hypothetical protein
MGTYQAVFRVTDNDGLTATVSDLTTTVRVGPTGSPSATASANPTSGNAPLVVSFTGTAITPDGTIVLYEWDFEGDGTYDWSSATTGSTSHTYIQPGTYVASFRATNSVGLTGIDQILITAMSTNDPPTADAGPDQLVEQETLAGTTVTLDGSGSTDDGRLQPLTYTWYEGGDALGTGVTLSYTFSLGTHTVTLAVDDAEFSDSDDVTITVIDTTLPTLDVADITAEQTSAEGTPVDIPAVATDICDPAPVVTHDGLTIYPLGETTVTFTATDASGNSTTSSITVTVVDTTPPEIILKDDVNILLAEGIWPPNHKYHTITIEDLVESVSDICDAGVSMDDIVIASVSSDEPEDEVGDGDGNTTDDIVIVGAQTVNLRSERQSTGNGRVYTINFAVTDASGNVATASVQVSVPHDKNTPAVEGPGPGYSVP